MIILEKIRLRNFRAIREAVFQPQLEGITGIFGSNGAGKTTFLAGTLFALFGVAPPNATIASLRRTGSGKEECSASVVFIHLGQTIEIIREIQATSKASVAVDIYVDGVPATVSSSKAANAWITQRLGVDAKGFTTAFIVRQKELDALVTDRPAERKDTIERLAGINTINEALVKARKSEKDTKEVLKSIPGSESAIDETEAQVHLLSNKVNELREVKETKQDELNSIQIVLKELTSQIEILRTTEASILRISSEISNLETSVEADQATVDRLGYVVKNTVDYDIQALRDRHKETIAKLSEANQKLNGLRVEKAQIENAIEAFTYSISDLEQKIAQSENISETELAENIETTKNSILTLRQANAVYGNKAEDYREKVTALSGDHKECPTCNTVLADVEGLVKDFETFASDFEQKQLDNIEEINKLQTQLSSQESQLRQANQLVQWKAKLEEDTQSLVTVKARLDTFADLTVIEKEIADLEEAKDSITEDGLTAKRFNDDKSQYEVANSNLTTKTQRIAQLYPELSEFKKLFSEEKYNAARIKQDKLQKEAGNLSSRMNEAYSELSTFESRLSVASNNLRSAIEQWKRKKELLAAQERKALTVEIIDKFRKDSIAALAPEISEHATDLISGITNGAYTEIRLDESFNITVVSSTGEERAVGWLSGGEESAVAFALRLAIAFLITGGNPSLLWLDEVLTAQDAERRSTMLSTIQNLPIDQIIMINHTEDANDIVDKVVTVIPNLLKGSILDSQDGANDNIFDDDEEENDPSAPSSLDDIEDDLTF